VRPLPNITRARERLITPLSQSRIIRPVSPTFIRRSSLVESLTHGYETLSQRYGITVIHDSVAAIDPVAKTVGLEGGAKLHYDRVVVASGIAFNYSTIEGYDEVATQTIPHAWNAGPQTKLLRQQLEGMEDGGLFVLVAPPDPFRCPPGPYERASLVAYYFKQYKPRAKILILDAKDSFFEQDLFRRRNQLSGNDRVAVVIIHRWAVDVKRRSTRRRATQPTPLSPHPAAMVGQLAQQAGLADQSGWCRSILIRPSR
jgi:hypothetical protein